MNKLIAIVAVILSAAAFGAKKERDWRIGKVVDALTSKASQVEGAHTTTTSTGMSANSSTTLQYSHVKTNDVIILGQDYVYNVDDSRTKGGAVPAVAIGRAVAGGRHHGCRFIVGEDIKYSQEKSTMYIIDVDGKECKTEILRQERLKPQ